MCEKFKISGSLPSNSAVPNQEHYQETVGGKTGKGNTVSGNLWWSSINWFITIIAQVPELLSSPAIITQWISLWWHGGAEVSTVTSKREVPCFRGSKNRSVGECRRTLGSPAFSHLQNRAEVNCSNLPVGVSCWLSFMWPCDELVTHPGCTPLQHKRDS